MNILWEMATPAEADQDLKYPWEGVVIDTMTGGTEMYDFVVFARKPSGGRFIRAYDDLESATDRTAYIEASINDSTLKRQFAALRTLCFDESRTDLGIVRDRLFADDWASNGTHWKTLPVVNLRDGPFARDNLPAEERQQRLTQLETDTFSLFTLNRLQIEAYRKTLKGETNTAVEQSKQELEEKRAENALLHQTINQYQFNDSDDDRMVLVTSTQTTATSTNLQGACSDMVILSTNASCNTFIQAVGRLFRMY